MRNTTGKRQKAAKDRKQEKRNTKEKMGASERKQI